MSYKIDFDGLVERVVRVPIEADNYTGLNVTPDYLVYRGSVRSSWAATRASQHP